MSEHKDSSQKDLGQSFLKDLLRVMLVPTLVNKAFMVYFGLQYSKYPGEGYGYGLLFTIFFLLFTVGTFLWKYRHVDDP